MILDFPHWKPCHIKGNNMQYANVIALCQIIKVPNYKKVCADSNFLIIKNFKKHANISNYSLAN